MDKMVQPRSAILVWAPLISASVPWATARLHLFTNDLVPTDTSVEADFTEATFTGYADELIAWQTAYIDADGQIIIPGDLHDFICSGGAGQILYGYFVIGAAGQFLGAARFADAPRTVAGAGSGISVAPVIGV